MDRVVGAVASDRVLPLLVLYVRAVCELAWDLTWDHRPLIAVLRQVSRTWEARRPEPVDPAHALATEAMTLLLGELAVESACSTGSLSDVGRLATTLLRRLTDAEVCARSLVPSGLREHLADLLASRRTYVDAVRVAAQTARDFQEGTDDRLDPAIASLHRAEEDLQDDHASLSEIRAHRSALEALEEARDRDWLRIDEGTAVAIYPFGLRHDHHDVIVALVKEHGHRWNLAGGPLGNAPTKLLLVDDIWRGDDPLRRRYEGTQLDLPDIVLSDGVASVTMKVTVVVSQLGNHDLRVEIPLEGVLPHTLASLIWLAAPEYGDLHELGRTIELADATRPARGWVRLTDFVNEVLVDLVAELRSDAAIEVELSFRPGMYHVVTSIQAASVLPGGRAQDARVLRDARRIPELFGSQPVCHPIPCGAGSIAFWTRYAAPVGDVVECAGLTDEYILVSENHTLLASFSSPDFMVGTVRQAAEFVVSLEGMFAAWQDELGHFYGQLTPYLDTFAEGVTSGHVPRTDRLDRVLDELEGLQIRLRRFVTSARVSLLFIGSPALVTSPVIRQTINQLLALNPVWAQRGEFTDVAGEALGDRLSDLMEAWARRRRERLEARNRVMIDTLLAVVAGIGISGVFAIVQAGYGVTGWGSTLLVVLVLAIAFVVGYVSYRWTRSGERRARSRRRAKK